MVTMPSNDCTTPFSLLFAIISWCLLLVDCCFLNHQQCISLLLLLLLPLSSSWSPISSFLSCLPLVLVSFVALLFPSLLLRTTYLLCYKYFKTWSQPSASAPRMRFWVLFWKSVRTNKNKNDATKFLCQLDFTKKSGSSSAGSVKWS